MSGGILNGEYIDSRGDKQQCYMNMYQDRPQDRVQVEEINNNE